MKFCGIATAAMVSLTLLSPVASFAQGAGANPGGPAGRPPGGQPPEATRRLPPDVSTKQTIELAGRTLHVTATAGSVTLNNPDGVAQAQIAFIAYTLDDADVKTRPVSFAMNGGPGTASAWLHLGLLGPWRMRMDPEAARPSADAVPSPNNETWLDFTDLVFIDPVGTGFSKLLVNNEENRKRYWSVNGDVATVADGIRTWLEQAHRMPSPKYIVGESYSGLRGPRLVRELTLTQSVGVTGLVLISPKLDYGGRSAALDPMSWVATLPSEVAAMRAKKGPVTRADLADAEAYAGGDYLTDLVRGENPDAVARIEKKVTELTGLDPALVARRHGRVTYPEFLREIEGDKDRIASPYDATVTSANPFPLSVQSFPSDPMTDALQPSFVSAILDLYATKLKWLPDGRYQMSNAAANRAWDFGNNYIKPESVTYLRSALAFDPKFHVLIAHGLFDVLTPYFDTKMMLDAIPKSVGADRIDFKVFPGGHMFYSRDASRSAFRDAARKLYNVPASVP